ncbi:MAG: rane protein [Paenibacillus sp.]|nr:rane protein [Paenibacillus sp.]
MPVWIQIVIRSAAALAVLLLMTRLLGKKQLSQLNFFHYIAGITIGNIAGFVSLEIESHFMLGVSAMLVWTFLVIGLEWLSLKSKHVRNWFEGEATVLIKDGKVLEDNLKKATFTSDELLEELRKKNAFRLADVEFAVLETDGNVSVMLTKENQPITPKHLGVREPNEQESQTVIMDGEIMDEPLATAGFSRGWLTAELEKIGVTRENVYLAQVDAYGQLTVDLYDDQLKTPQPSQRELLWATLRKCEADLELFTLATKDRKVKKKYESCVRSLKSVVGQVEPYLKR